MSKRGHGTPSPREGGGSPLLYPIYPSEPVGAQIPGGGSPVTAIPQKGVGDENPLPF